MITVACVYKTEPSSPYSPDDVLRLYNAVTTELCMPSRFICLADHPGHIARVSGGAITSKLLQHGWRGWWSKLELFRLPGPVLYFDLDTVITGNIDALAQAVLDSKRLMLLRGFYQGDRCTGIMGWSAEFDAGRIFRAFEKDVLSPPCYVESAHALRMKCKSGVHRGDQEWLDKLLGLNKVQVLFAQDLVTGIRSYKVHVRGNGLPSGTRVVCFHGRPRPHEVADEHWMKRHWLREWHDYAA